MKLENELLNIAQDFVTKRYPTGWGGCAVMRLSSGEIITSVAPEVELEALGLCMEVGAICEAHKQNKAVTHSLCISRENEQSDFVILSPCGICQEYLRFWGGDVQVAVTNKDNKLLFKSLYELQPYHWLQAFKNE